MAPKDIKFWESFYKIRYYPSITKEQTTREVQFIGEFLPIGKYRNILDFICGFGRHSIALAKLGYNIEGFDIDGESIRRANSVIRQLKLNNIKLRVGDAVSFNERNAFDAAICLYSSVGFFGNERRNDEALSNLFNSVRVGGRVILDVMNAEWAITHLKALNRKTLRFEDKVYIAEHRREILKDPLREKNNILFIDPESGSQHTASYTVRLYKVDEIVEKFTSASFEIDAIFGSFKKARVSKENQRLIVVATRG